MEAFGSQITRLNQNRCQWIRLNKSIEVLEGIKGYLSVDDAEMGFEYGRANMPPICMKHIVNGKNKCNEDHNPDNLPHSYATCMLEHPTSGSLYQRHLYQEN